MAKKKKLTKAERKEARLRKGKQWLLTYTGSPKKINKHYRERFHVDAVTAAKAAGDRGACDLLAAKRRDPAGDCLPGQPAGPAAGRRLVGGQGAGPAVCDPGRGVWLNRKRRIAGSECPAIF